MRGGRERAACPAPDCGFVHWDNPVPIVAAIVELEDYRIVPITELKPWSQGTGPALRDWLRARGYEPEVVEFGEHV